MVVVQRTMKHIILEKNLPLNNTIIRTTPTYKFRLNLTLIESNLLRMHLQNLTFIQTTYPFPPDTQNSTYPNLSNPTYPQSYRIKFTYTYRIRPTLTFIESDQSHINRIRRILQLQNPTNHFPTSNTMIGLTPTPIQPPSVGPSLKLEHGFQEYLLLSVPAVG